MQIVTDHLPHPVPFQGLATKRKGKHCLMNNSQLGSVRISASNWASVSIAVCCTLGFWMLIFISFRIRWRSSARTVRNQTRCPHFGMSWVVLVKDKGEKIPLSYTTSGEQIMDVRISWEPPFNAASVPCSVTWEQLWLDLRTVNSIILCSCEQCHVLSLLLIRTPSFLQVSRLILTWWKRLLLFYFIAPSVPWEQNWNLLYPAVCWHCLMRKDR